MHKEKSSQKVDVLIFIATYFIAYSTYCLFLNVWHQILNLQKRSAFIIFANL